MPFEAGHALIIGVGSHRYAPRLNAPATVADAQAVAAVLRDERFCGYPPGQVAVLHDEATSRDGILEALDQLAQGVQAKDAVLIFYSGHGEYGEDGNYYLVSHDAQIKDRRVVSGTGVSQAALLKKLRNLPAEHVLMIFNACHAGQLSPVLGVEDDLGSKNLPTHTAEALLATGSGRVIITACREGQYSFIGSGNLTLFAQALVDALQGKTTTGRGGFVSAFDLYTAVYDSVSQAVGALSQSKYEQQPELTVLKGVGPFAVSLYRGATETKPGLVQSAGDPPDYTTVRRVRLERAQYLMQTQIVFAGRDIHIDTGGGDFTGRDKIVHGDEVHGDKVGGDKITLQGVTGTGIAIGRNARAYVYQGISAQELESLFLPVLAALRGALPDQRPQAEQMAAELKEEAAKGEEANDRRMADLIDGLVRLVPQAVGAIVAAFSQPLLAGIAGPVTQSILSRMQGR